MSFLVTLNGQNYVMPDKNEVGWGSNLTDFFTAIPAGVLQKTGGSFTLSAETDFGASYGLKALYYKSRTANVAGTGQVRLASADAINFRNAANGADISLAKDGSDNLQWNSKKILLSGDVVNADINASAAITYSKLALTSSIVNADLSASAAIARSKVATGTAYVLPVNSSTGALSEVSGVGSSGQVLTSNGASNLPTWQNVAGTGTVNSGTANHLAYYASSTNAVSSLSTVTTTEVGYLSGVTSAIQTQLDAKVSLSGNDTMTGSKSINSAWSIGDSGYFKANATNGFRINDSANSINVVVLRDNGQTQFRDGTVGTPSVSLQSDTDSGFYSVSANKLGVSTGGVKVATFDAGGVSNGTTYNPLSLFGGLAASNGQTDFEKQTTSGITNSPTTIITINSDSAFLIVTGSDSGGANHFIDLLLVSASTSPTVVVSKAGNGSPAARTYTSTGAAQKVSLASGTYGINALAISLSRANG